MTRSTRPVLLCTGVALVVTALTGCSGGSPTPTPTVTTTSTVTATPTATPRPTESSRPATPTPAATAGSGESSPSGCSTGHLSGAIVDDGGGAAGHLLVAIALTNTGEHSCTLQGWPGVSLVGDGNGTQLGAPATLDRSSPHPTITLAPNAVARAALNIVQAAAIPSSSCRPQTADGFRVYPPGEKAGLFIKDGSVTACRNAARGLLTVKAFIPG